MKTKGPNVAASVKARLHNLARVRGEDLNHVIIRYAQERLLFRLGQSQHRDVFILKGATLFVVWEGTPHRPTRDLDLLGSGDPDLVRLRQIFASVCQVVVPDDGLVFDAGGVTTASIREEALYDGIRVQVPGVLKVRHSQWKGQIVSPKSGRHREIPLNSKLTAVLKAHRHLRGGFVFCQEEGSALTQQICRKALMRACKRAGLRHMRWHSLRHSFASHLVMRRMPMKAVQELMGHATITMTLRYSHLSPDVRKDAVEALVQEIQGHNSGTWTSAQEIVQ